MPTLDFKGKQFVYSHHLSVPFRQLVINKRKSLADGAPSLDDNLIIHGDNLHALKALLPTYAGKIKCIYIDPPYNTGNEGWCYNDNVNGPLIREWLKKSANPVEKEDLERHDKWLCMMWPRLQLLKELLSDDGAIFVSIDDNELNHLVGALTEIFCDHHIATVPILNNLKGRNDKANFSLCHEYLVIFARDDFVAGGLPLTDKQLAAFKHTDQKGKRYALRDLRRRGGDDTRKARAQLYFPLYLNENEGSLAFEQESKSDIEIFPVKSDGTDGRWRWGKDKVGDNLEILEASYVRKSHKWNVSYRVYLDEEESDDDDDGWNEENGEPFERTTKSKSFWWGPEISTDRAGKELKELLKGSGSSFDHPKPVEFVRRIIHLMDDRDMVVLDSFAGSGTTANAVLAQNAEDGGNRKFILIECEDYADKITAERVRRVIRGVPKAKDETLKEGLGGSFTYCTTGDEINIETLLHGGMLPGYEILARYVFYTATGRTLGKVSKPRPDFFIGETEVHRVHLIYKPDRVFLRSNGSALNAEMVDRIAKSNKAGKKCLVFATAKFMGQKELIPKKIEFCQLPYAIHRILGD